MRVPDCVYPGLSRSPAGRLVVNEDRLGIVIEDDAVSLLIYEGLDFESAVRFDFTLDQFKTFARYVAEKAEIA